MDKKVQKHVEICDKLSTIYEKKNSDYNDSFGKSFTEYGMTMPCIRLEDKLNRLKALTVHNKEQQVNDESVEDTLLDLANYAIMTVIELNMEESYKELDEKPAQEDCVVCGPHGIPIGKIEGGKFIRM